MAKAQLITPVKDGMRKEQNKTRDDAGKYPDIVHDETDCEDDGFDHVNAIDTEKYGRSLTEVLSNRYTKVR
jgi:hypothetical protein